MNKKMVRFLALAGMGALALASLVATAQSGRSTVVWFVGVGTGGQPAQIDAEKAAVDRAVLGRCEERLQAIQQFLLEQIDAGQCDAAAAELPMTHELKTCDQAISCVGEKQNND